METVRESRSQDRARAALWRRCTQIELTWLERRIERWIRFGHDCGETILDRRRILRFAPRNVFAFVRWASNDFGTIVSRIGIVRAINRGEPYQMLPFVPPGGRFRCGSAVGRRSSACCRRSMPWRRSASIPPTLHPDYWGHLHNRLVAGEPPRPYSRARHRAWLLYQRLPSNRPRPVSLPSSRPPRHILLAVPTYGLTWHTEDVAEVPYPACEMLRSAAHLNLPESYAKGQA
jgi:hypothetical protein